MALHFDAGLIPFVDAYRLSQFHIARQHGIKHAGQAQWTFHPETVVDHLVLMPDRAALLEHHVLHAVVALDVHLPVPSEFIIHPSPARENVPSRPAFLLDQHVILDHPARASHFLLADIAPMRVDIFAIKQQLPTGRLLGLGQGVMFAGPQTGSKQARGHKKMPHKVHAAFVNRRTIARNGYLPNSHARGCCGTTLPRRDAEWRYGPWLPS